MGPTFANAKHPPPGPEPILNGDPYQNRWTSISKMAASVRGIANAHLFFEIMSGAIARGARLGRIRTAKAHNSPASKDREVRAATTKVAIHAAVTGTSLIEIG